MKPCMGCAAVLATQGCLTTKTVCEKIGKSRDLPGLRPHKRTALYTYLDKSTEHVLAA